MEVLCSNTIISELNTLEKAMSDSEITEKECYESLVNFKNDTSPGNDGLMKEFYVAFRKKISGPLLDCYKYSQDVKSLSNSQRQAIITLLEQAGKDRSYLKTWRPIFLLNLKVLGIRVKNVLPSIISNCQSGYVVNKSLNDSIRIV